MKLSESQIQKLEKLIAYYFEENYFHKTHEKEEEGYKWVAMKIFQMEGVAKAADENFFVALKKALNEAYNLLYSKNKSTLIHLINAHEVELRIEFQKLEQGDRKDLKERLTNFLSATNAMVQRDTTRKLTLLEASDAMTCLAFLQPDKYYIYRSAVLKTAYTFLGKPDTCSGKAVDRACEFHDLCELILQYIREHHADKFKKYLDFVRSDETMYADESGHLLVQNLLYALQSLNGISNTPVQDQTFEAKNYWWLTANPKIWSYADIKIGDEQSYTLYNENGNKRRIFQNFLDAKVGDVVIGYEANPTKKIVALAKITRENDGQSLYFEKTEVLSEPIEYAALKGCPELEKMEFFIQPNGSLFRLTKEEFDFIMDVVREENPLEKQDAATPKYTKEDFLEDVYMTADQYDELKELLLNKMNVILQGAPGVGKTFSAKRLAYSIMGEKDDSRIEMIQFHQNYSYEDFIMGYRPDGETFKLTEGIFYSFCQKALNHPDKEYFFIIDEINRGNMSKIFGELLMLIEKDYRGTETTLAYDKYVRFSVPENIYIIGMMNTADRSLAMIDYALRRRFSFFEIEPGFASDGFKKYQKQFSNDRFDQLIEHVKSLNEEISDDKSLGKGFRIGHSYFCGRKADACTDAWMRAVVKFDILPMLSEYWFDEPDKIESWKENFKWYIR